MSSPLLVSAAWPSWLSLSSYSKSDSLRSKYKCILFFSHVHPINSLFLANAVWRCVHSQSGKNILRVSSPLHLPLQTKLRSNQSSKQRDHPFMSAVSKRVGRLQIPVGYQRPSIDRSQWVRRNAICLGLDINSHSTGWSAVNFQGISSLAHLNTYTHTHTFSLPLSLLKLKGKSLSADISSLRRTKMMCSVDTTVGKHQWKK
jgi:hypothetical protein